jgi:hypothetical protein
MAAAVKRRKPYRARFVLIYAGLVAAIGAAAAGLVLVLTGSGSSSTRPAAPKVNAWSTWAPTASSASARVREIANHVAGVYRLPNGNQLLDVTVRPPSIPDGSGSRLVRISFVVVKGPHSEQTAIGPSNSELFNLCRFGNACLLPTKPTPGRMLLIRRATLEIALYTFKYVPEIKYVLEVLPPVKGTSNPALLYFHRRDLARELQLPLARTLRQDDRISTIAPNEDVLIDRLTKPHMFSLSAVANQQGTAVLALSPVGS